MRALCQAKAPPGLAKQAIRNIADTLTLLVRTGRDANLEEPVQLVAVVRLVLAHPAEVESCVAIDTVKHTGKGILEHLVPQAPIQFYDMHGGSPAWSDMNGAKFLEWICRLKTENRSVPISPHGTHKLSTNLQVSLKLRGS